MSTTTAITKSQEILATLGKKQATKEISAVDEQQTRFLKLLTTQLKNQDPLNPTDSAQTTSQLAQISTVDGIERLNATLTQLVGSFKSNESLQAASLVGRQVLVPGKDLQLEKVAANGSEPEKSFALGGVDLAGPADHVTLSIFDANGIQVDSRDIGPMDAGSQMFIWDGKTANGTIAAAGNYTMKVTATRGDAKVDTTALEMATVSSVVTGGKDISIDLGNAGKVLMSDIKRIL